jgi:proline dehydrogenase
MDNVSEIVALLRKQADLEIAIMNGLSSAVATEQELEATRRRLFAHPQALNAVLQTARALRRTPDAVSVREVTDFGGSNSV